MYYFFNMCANFKNIDFLNLEGVVTHLGISITKGTKKGNLEICITRGSSNVRVKIETAGLYHRFAPRPN